jgi:hypothetical protein
MFPHVSRETHGKIITYMMCILIVPNCPIISGAFPIQSWENLRVDRQNSTGLEAEDRNLQPKS